MKIACFLGTLGSLLSILTGIWILDFSLGNACLCILGANAAGMLSLLFTLEWEHGFSFRWSKNTSDLRATLHAWIFLSLSYLGSLLTFVPALRSLQAMLVMSLPLLLSLGFCILVFGPIRDTVVRRRQKRFSCVPSDSIL